MQKPLLLLFGTLLLIFTSCKKYDDGGITINAKNKITKHEWIFDKAFEYKSSMNHFTQNNVSYIYKFKDNGDLEIQIKDIIDTNSYKIGTWELINKNKTLRIMRNTEIDSSINKYFIIWPFDNTISTFGIDDPYYPNNYLNINDTIIDYPIFKLTKNEFCFTVSMSFYTRTTPIYTTKTDIYLKHN